MKRRKGRIPFDDVTDLEKATVHVGEVFVGVKPTVVQTLLGSCVSVCLIDRVAGIGGMNHILLPGKPDLHRFDASARYGVNAMEILIGGIQRAGAERRRLEAKVFGGANVLAGLEKTFNPGFRNGAFVMEFLELEGIPVIGHDTGGFNARRIYLRTDTGEVFMKRIPRYQASNIVIEEKEYGRRVAGELSQKGRVTLFEE
jgi:chemotaxis protein CheD